MKGFRQKLNRNKRVTSETENSPQRTGSPATTTGAGNDVSSIHGGGEHGDVETPEAAAQRLVRTFCMSEVDEAGAEVALLPSIVETAESSPQAASECARYIRKFLYRDYWSQPNFVYNAIMLMRILVENPGLTFTRNMNKKFVDTVRDVLRGCQHAHIVHFLMETLQDFERKGAIDEGMGRLLEMWQKEKIKSKSVYLNQPQQLPGGQGERAGQWQQSQPPAWPGQGQNAAHSNGQGHASPGGFPGPGSGGSSRGPYERRHGSSATLPKPSELRRRLREAKTTAGVLADVVNTTTPVALLKHDLADDLSSRCHRATNQVLEYLNTRDPIPDNFEMADLLATHEVLEQTLHHYYRTVLEARKSLGIGETRRDADGKAPVEMTPAGKGKATAPASPSAAGPGTNASRVSGNDINHDGPVDFSASPRSADKGVDRNQDNDMLAAAIAASTAPGAHARPMHGAYQAGGGSSSAAHEIDNPFADNLPASSQSSLHVRPSYGGSGGDAGGSTGMNGGSSAAGGARGWSYVDSDNESDEEYLRIRRRNKAAAAEAGGSSSTFAAAGGSSTGQRAMEGASPGAAGASSSSSYFPPPAVPSKSS
ncbi:hypothetical protein SEPCBS119000_004181 [Sporothrix epigloea]|uniref:VHS domain-containing protein n=1 Tax=Sporothrix epigloea TaxID=1892477 RepID=A0ABP0DQT6_9PEZI